MRIFLVAFAAMVLLGCSDGGKQLFETAQFEEQQRNLPHARSLYAEIVGKHPDSPYGKQAQERLRQLGK